MRFQSQKLDKTIQNIITVKKVQGYAILPQSILCFKKELSDFFDRVKIRILQYSF